MALKYKPTCGLIQPAYGVNAALPFAAMPKKAGRPPKPPDPKRGIFKVLSDNVTALLEHRMRVDDSSHTEAMHDIAKKAGVSPSTVQRAYNGRVATGIDTLEGIAKATKIEPADLLIEGACKKIMNTRMRSSSPGDTEREFPDDARTLHGTRRQ